MKKLICAVLVLLLALGGFSALAESNDTTMFEPSLANAMDKTLDEWYSTSYNRALLSVLLALNAEKALTDSSLEFANLWRSPTYICRDEDSLTLIGNIDGHMTMIIYTPGMIVAGVYIDPENDTTDSLLELVLPQVFPMGYYKNNTDDLLDAVSFLQEIANN